MEYTFTKRSGQDVEVHVAAAFDRMAAAFKAANHCDLIVNSGTRSSALQQTLFRQRYRVQSKGSGSYNDVRYWRGSRWVRVSGAGNVAIPGTSLHEAGGPRGPRALDLRDNGRGPGANAWSNSRQSWLAANAGKFGFTNAGYNFREPWHKEFQGSLTRGATAGITAHFIPRVQPAPLYHGRELSYGMTGSDVLSLQNFLVGPKIRSSLVGTPDGSYGSRTVTAVKWFQHTIGGAQDGRVGPQTGSALVWRGWRP